MEKRFIIIDGNSLVNRAYYAMQRPMITKEGVYTQGIYGFINILHKLEKEYKSGYIAIAFDMKAPTFRHKEYDQYKAGRKKMPYELAMQLPILRRVLDAMNIATFEMEGFEADDIIGTLSLMGEEFGLEPLIITGDKDELQLASEKTKVMITKKGISQFDIYDREAMFQRYGFSPEAFIDFKGLMGDASDNIPGVPGVGEKTAMKLIMEYGSIENLLNNTSDLKGKLKEKIEDNSQSALMSKRLATINRNMPIEVDLHNCRWIEAEKDKLTDIYRELEFNSFLKRLSSESTSGHIEATERKYEGGSAFETSRPKGGLGYSVEEKVYSSRIITETSHLNLMEELNKDMREQGCIVLKIFGWNNIRNLKDAIGAAVIVGDNYYYVNLTVGTLAKKFFDGIEEIKPEIVGHNLKNDYRLLMCGGVTSFNTGFDTAICKYVINPGRNNYTIGLLTQEYLEMTVDEEETFLKERDQMNLFDSIFDDFAKYGMIFCKSVKMLKEIMAQQIVEEGEKAILYDVELPLIEVMAAMEYRGFQVDREVLSCLGSEIEEKIHRLTKDIHDLAGEEFNIKSPKQLGPILFEKLGLPGKKKTKTGYGTGAEILERIVDEHPIVPMVLEYRMLTKLSGTYVAGLLPLVGKNNRINADFNQTIAATGRISSSNPNLQNIPVRSDLGRKIRKAFVAKDGYTLIGADYSQIELRVLAHMSGDKALIKSFNDGEDIHRATAARVLGIPEDDITSIQRSRAKAVNFGVIYGMSAFGLSNEIDVSRKEAEEYIQQYFEKHGAVKEFMADQVKYCKEHGFVKTILGRKRYINEIKASNFMVRQMGERLAMNSPIQGSAADIIKLAMIRVEESLKGMESKLILQVHDELIVEAHLEEAAKVKEILIDGMGKAYSMDVELAVDVNEGKSWYQLK